MGNLLIPGEQAAGPHRNGAEPINSFALVTYISGRLGEFVDDLRRELVPACTPRAHVTILPPRPIAVSPDEAWDYIYPAIRDFPAFEVKTAPVEIFDCTSVIFISLATGREELRRMHDALNRGPVGFAEPYTYHPHITLAQDLRPEDVAQILETAKARWAEYSGERSFSADSVTFVQNTACNRWLDLAHCQLGVPSIL